jgi:hypothetical protein
MGQARLTEQTSSKRDAREQRDMGSAGLAGTRGPKWSRKYKVSALLTKKDQQSLIVVYCHLS